LVADVGPYVGPFVVRPVMKSTVAGQLFIAVGIFLCKIGREKSNALAKMFLRQRPAVIKFFPSYQLVEI